MIKDSGHREAMGDTGFVRDTHAGKGRMDLLPWYAILELAKHCEEGALKYGERNADLGIPLHSLLDSGARHLAKYIAGEREVACMLREQLAEALPTIFGDLCG